MEVITALAAGIVAGLLMRFALFRPKREETIVLADITGIVVGSIIAAAVYAFMVDQNASPVAVVPAIALIILLAVGFKLISTFTGRERLPKTDGWKGQGTDAPVQDGHFSKT